jgi:fructosamine-3-kinase
MMAEVFRRVTNHEKIFRSGYDKEFPEGASLKARRDILSLWSLFNFTLQKFISI